MLACCAGALSGKGKIPYAILALLDVIRHYPGQVSLFSAVSSFWQGSQQALHDQQLHATAQNAPRPVPPAAVNLCGKVYNLQHCSLQSFAVQVPDIDAIISTSDFSCIKATPPGQQPTGPPVFGYNSDPAHEDVPFPDYSYWGHEYTRLRGALSHFVLFGLLCCVCHALYTCHRITATLFFGQVLPRQALCLSTIAFMYMLDRHINSSSLYMCKQLECVADEYFYYWHGWDLQHKWIRQLYANTTLTDRHSQAIWRGRVADDDYPERDALRYT